MTHVVIAWVLTGTITCGAAALLGLARRVWRHHVDNVGVVIFEDEAHQLLRSGDLRLVLLKVEVSTTMPAPQEVQ